MAVLNIFGELDFAATYTAGARTHGVQFDVTKTVWVTHIRFARKSTSVAQPTTAAIYPDVGTQAIEGSSISIPSIGTQTGWFMVSLPQPVRLDPGRYRVATHTPGSGTLTHHGVGSFFSNGAGASGYAAFADSPIRAPGASTATNNAQSCYTDGSAISKPLTSSGSKALYPVDVQITDVNPFIEPKNIAGSTRSTSNTLSRGTARKRLRAALSSVSSAIGRGVKRALGRGATSSASTTSSRGMGRHNARGSVSSVSTVSGSGRRGRTLASSWPVRSLSTTSGSGRARKFGQGSTTSFTAIRGGGGTVAGGEAFVYSQTSGGGYFRAIGMGSASATSTTGLGSYTAKHRARGSVITSSRTAGHARGRRFCTRSAVRSTSSTRGAGLVRIIGAAGIARPHAGMAIRLFEANGAVSDYAPDWRGITFTDLYNEPGTIGIEYLKRGVNANQLMTDRTEGALFDGSIEIPGTRFLVTQQASDGVTEGSAGETVAINAPLWVSAHLGEAKVYPPGYPKRSEATKTQFAAVTPGHIIGTLINQAKNRGAIPNLVQGFTAAADSRGLPWKTKVSLEVEMGVSIMSVIQTLVEMDVLDWTTQGRELVLRNSDTGRDHTVGDNPLVLQAGRDMLDAPEKRDVTEYFTCVLVEGEEGLWVEVRNDAEYARRGRIEGFVSASGIKDEGTLRVIGEATLARAGMPKTENTHSLSLFSLDSPQPWIDYTVGDYLLRSTGDGAAPERMRVAQLSFTVADDGIATASITLGDRFWSTDMKLKRRVDNLTRGSSGSTAPADKATTDRTPPEKPVGLLVSSNAYSIEDGQTMAAVAASWVPVVRSIDGSTASDLDYYEVRWRVVRNV